MKSYKIPFLPGVAFATNDLGWYLYTAAIVLFVAKVVGASQLTWPGTLLGITGCIIFPSVLATVMEKIAERRAKKSPPKPEKGGDVTLLTGNGDHGGSPGRVILVRKQTQPGTPLVVLYDEQTGGQLNVLMGPLPPDGEVDAPANSFYIQHFRGGSPQIWWKLDDGNAKSWEHLLGNQPN